MAFTNYDKLSIVKLNEPKESISFSELEEIIINNPTYSIYFELDNKLFGLITMDDIKSAADNLKDYVEINKDYKSINEKNLISALELFNSDKELNIVLVIDNNNNLLGEYTRWNNSIDSVYNNPFLQDIYNSDYLLDIVRQYEYLLIKPNGSFEWKEKAYNNWVKYFNDKNINYKEIYFNEISTYKKNNEGNIPIFSSQEEVLASYALFKCIKKDYNYYPLLSISTYSNFFNNSIFEEVLSHNLRYTVLQYLINNGANVLVLDDSSDYKKRAEYDKKIEEKYNSIGKDYRNFNSLVEPELRKSFFGELYSDKYAVEVSYLPFEEVCSKGIYYLKNVKNKYLNVINGHRITTNQPKNPSQEILFFGPCVVMGLNVEDKYTIESQLQDILNNNNYNVKVSNYGGFGEAVFEVYKIINTPIKKNDIIVYYISHNKREKNIETLSLFDIVYDNNINVNWLTDTYVHSNHKLNKIYANEIFNSIKKYLSKDNKKNKNELIDMPKFFPPVDNYLKSHFSHFDYNNYGSIGSIVINANPFTNGHKYLVDKALEYVDYLIIFVVEENRSIFPFDLRFAMVNEALKDYNNVLIVPSGNFIVSNQTFPEYFVKVYDDDLINNMEFDIEIFAKKIAPKLNIKYRFVGEEPKDEITNEYNNVMRRILPKYGIEFISFPRVQYNNEILCATDVRENIKNNRYDIVKEQIPECNIKYLNWENK